MIDAKVDFKMVPFIFITYTVQRTNYSNKEKNNIGTLVQVHMFNTILSVCVVGPSFRTVNGTSSVLVAFPLSLKSSVSRAMTFSFSSISFGIVAISKLLNAVTTGAVWRRQMCEEFTVSSEAVQR